MIVVVGGKEQGSGTVTVRSRDDTVAASLRAAMQAVGVAHTGRQGGAVSSEDTTTMTGDELLAVCAELTRQHK